MNSKAAAALVIVIVIVVAGAFVLIRSRGRMGPSPTDTITTAAGDEGEAKSVVETQFRQDYSNTPPTAAISVELNDVNSEYWTATASYGSNSKSYWVPKERPKGLRIQVGQSQTYAMTMSMPTSTTGTTSIDATYIYTVTEQTTYEGVPCYKIQISGSATAMGMSVPYSGYMYIDTENYRTRYMTLTMTATTTGQTITMTTEQFYNYNTHKLHKKTTMNGQVYSDTETDMSTSTFDQNSMQGFLDKNLYVGWSDNFSFQSDNTKYTMTLTVTKEEIITVPAGTFRCYVLSTAVPEIEGIDMTCNIWVNAQMTLVPKMELSVSYHGQNVLSLTMTLQDYSGY